MITTTEIPMNGYVGMYGMRLITVSDWTDVEEFSVQMLKTQTPFAEMSQGKITITAANGRWVYRPVGKLFSQDTIIAVLESHEHFELRESYATH